MEGDGLRKVCGGGGGSKNPVALAPGSDSLRLEAGVLFATDVFQMLDDLLDQPFRG